MTTQTKRQPRNRRDGRYTFDGNLDRLCVCGQTLGLHGAEAPHPGNAIIDGVLTETDCPRFRPAKTE